MFYLRCMQRIAMLLTVLVALLGFAAPAGAQQSNAPPGNAGVDEYLETVPEAEGNRPTGSDSGASPLSSATRQRLEREGVDGQAAADLAERTGPTVAEQDRSAELSPRSEDDSVSPIVRAAGGSDDGMGLWLPILLGLVALAAVGAVILKRRSSGSV